MDLMVCIVEQLNLLQVSWGANLLVELTGAFVVHKLVFASGYKKGGEIVLG